MIEITLPEAVYREKKGKPFKDGELRQRFNWIVEYQELNGFAPNHREIAQGWGVSAAAVGHSLDVMQERGWLEYVSGQGRMIRILRGKFDQVIDK